MPMSTATYIRTPVMVGKSTIRVRRRRSAPVVHSLASPARSAALRSSHAAPAVGRMREAIHRGPIENSRRALRERTDSPASVRTKQAGSVVRAKAASAVVAVALGLIDWAAGQEVPRDPAAVASGDGDKE